MSEINDGGPAFPLPVADQECCGRFESGYGGMSLRDWFAAKAIQGLLASPDTSRATLEQIVSDSYRIADEMIKER